MKNLSEKETPFWVFLIFPFMGIVLGIANLVRAIVKPKKTILWMLTPIRVVKQFLW